VACHLNSLTDSYFCLWIWSTRHGYSPRKAGRFTGADFPLQPNGTLQCPACHALHRKARRRARWREPARAICGKSPWLPPLPVSREQYQWEGHETRKPEPAW